MGWFTYGKEGRMIKVDSEQLVQLQLDANDWKRDSKVKPSPHCVSPSYGTSACKKLVRRNMWIGGATTLRNEE